MQDLFIFSARMLQLPPWWPPCPWLGAIVTVFGGSCNREKKVLLNPCISNKKLTAVVSNMICDISNYIYMYTSNIIYYIIYIYMVQICLKQKSIHIFMSTQKNKVFILGPEAQGKL